MINVALYGRGDDTAQLLASFERGFDRGQSEVARTVTGESGAPLWPISARTSWGAEYVALMLAAQEAGKPVKSAATETRVYAASPMSIN